MVACETAIGQTRSASLRIYVNEFMTGFVPSPYTPERNQILGIFAVSKLDEVTEGYVLGSGP